MYSAEPWQHFNDDPDPGHSDALWPGKPDNGAALSEPKPDLAALSQLLSRPDRRAALPEAQPKPNRRAALSGPRLAGHRESTLALLPPPPPFVYESRSYARAHHELTEAVRCRDGLTVVTGPSGAGKTMLVRTVLQQVDPPMFMSIVVNPFLGSGDLLRQILCDFGAVADPPPSAGPERSSVNDLVVTLEKFLAAQLRQDARAVLVIDDAHALPPIVFEELRALTNLEANGMKRLQIFLVGQPALAWLLRMREGKPIAQRVSRRSVMQVLSRDEVADYIVRRLDAVHASPTVPGSLGDAPDPNGTNAPVVAPRELVRFTPAAIGMVAAISRRMPRAIDLMCDRSLEVALERGTPDIDCPLVVEAARRLEWPVPIWRRVSAPKALAAVAVSAAILVLALLPGKPLFNGASFSSRESESRQVTAPSAKDVQKVQNLQNRPNSQNRQTTQRLQSHQDFQNFQSLESLPSPSGPLARTDSYLIVAGSFKSEQKTRQMTSQLVDQGLPAFFRQDPAGRWFALLIGPYVSAEEAKEAQKQLPIAEFPSTQIRLERP